ncbi:hypothetical protein BGY98DRAFT_1002944, partial [Russula aff. rugulosa BPL654]
DGGCAAPPSPTAAKTFSIPSSPPSEGRSADLHCCAKNETKLVRLIDKQESALFPAPWKFIWLLALIAAAMPDSVFSLRIEVAQPTSSSQRERGPQSPAQPYQLNIERTSLTMHQLSRRRVLQAAQTPFAVKTPSA